MTGKGATLSLLLTAVDRATGPLNRINASVRRMTGPVREFQTALQKPLNVLSSTAVSAGLPVLQKRWQGVGQAVDGVGTAATTTLRRLGGITIAAGAIAYGVKRQFIDVAANFERMQFRLESSEGSAEKASKAFDFISGMSLKSPFSIDSITDGFTRLRMNGIEPTNGSLQAIVDSVAKVGGTSAMLDGVTTALGQMMSKGRVSAEEMNQLGERGINGWEVLSRYTARTGQKREASELRKMAEDGQLDSKKAIPAILEQLGIESAGKAEEMSRTWTGMIAGLGTRWDLFKKRVMATGPFKKLTDRLRQILAAVDAMAANGRLQAWADWLGAKFLQAFGWIERGFIWLRDEGPRVFDSLREKASALFAFADAVARAFGGWQNLGLFALGAYVAGPLVGAFLGLAAAVASLGAAIGFTPVGWLLGAFAAIAGASLLVIAHWDKVGSFFKDMWSGIVDAFAGGLEVIRGLLTLDFSRALDGLKRSVGGIWRTGKTAVVGSAQAAAAGGTRVGKFLTAPRGDQVPATVTPALGRMPWQPPQTAADVIAAAGLNRRRDGSELAAAGDQGPRGDQVPATVTPALGRMPWQPPQTAADVIAAAGLNRRRDGTEPGDSHRLEGPAPAAAMTTMGDVDLAGATATPTTGMAQVVATFAAAVREFQRARVKVDVSGPSGTRASAPKEAPIDLSLRIAMGVSNLESM